MDQQSAHRIEDRIDSTVRNIASGHNACGTLINQDGALNTQFIRESVRPALETYESEIAAVTAQRDALLRDVETKRFALENVVQNLAIPDGFIMESIRKALPNHQLLSR